ncbi:MAG: hypothetical protein ABSG89_09055 [Bacteroidales bacterium]|jgi:hypothetical protein
MRKVIFFSLTISMIIWSCIHNQEKKSPIEGTWKLISNDSHQYSDTSFQAMIKNGQIRTFSKGYFTYVGHFEDELDTGIYGYAICGAGTYTLQLDRYEETYIYHSIKPMIEHKYKGLVEVRNDTLFYRYNIDTQNSWVLNKVHGTEIYVRLK